MIDATFAMWTGHRWMKWVTLWSIGMFKVTTLPKARRQSNTLYLLYSFLCLENITSHELQTNFWFFLRFSFFSFTILCFMHVDPLQWQIINIFCMRLDSLFCDWHQKMIWKLAEWSKRHRYRFNWICDRLLLHTMPWSGKRVNSRQTNHWPETFWLCEIVMRQERKANRKISLMDRYKMHESASFASSE